MVEALLRSDVPDVYSHLDLTLEELNALTSSTHSSIKAKATKVSWQRERCIILLETTIMLWFVVMCTEVIL